MNAFLPPEHAGCAAELKSSAAALGLDLHVSAVPPIVVGPYTTEPMTCPHGVTFWFEPTGEQIAYYVKNGIQ